MSQSLRATILLIVMSILIPTGVLLSLAMALSANPPQFSDYPVRKVYRGKTALPKFGDLAQYHGTDLRCFGADPEAYVGRRANFAGHFVIDACTCGSGCHYLFMWDTRTGELNRGLPFGALNVGPYIGNESASPVEYSGESFQPNSRLLIIEACREGTCDCGKKYYVWTGATFRLISKLVSRVPPNCRR